MFSLQDFLRSGTILSIPSGKVIIGWGERIWSSNPSNAASASFYFPDFFLQDKTPWFTQEQTAEWEIDALYDVLSAKCGAGSRVLWKSPEKIVFEKEFRLLKEELLEKRLSKAVPYLFETTEHFDQKRSLQKSLCSLIDYARRHRVYIYGFWSESEGMLGATPEILFTKNQNRVQTMACAGTFPLGQQDRLEKDVKIAEEHNLVIEGIKESLTPLGKVEVATTETVIFPPLCHRITPVEMTLNRPAGFHEIVTALHPTPALGAHPKLAGKHWLQEFDARHSRGRFGAPVGLCFHEDVSACYVAIRNIQWSKGCARIGAGCGVIATSDCQAEWQELELKILAIKQILAL